jgi:hypothetical protein
MENINIIFSVEDKEKLIELSIFNFKSIFLKCKIMN